MQMAQSETFKLIFNQTETFLHSINQKLIEINNHDQIMNNLRRKWAKI